MQPALLDAVSQIASDPARRIYAVMDGARFDDLPAELSNFGLAHRSLYRSVQDIELVKAGPWLIDPYHLPDPLANVWGGMPLAGDITPTVRADTEEALSQRDLAGPRDAESYNAGKRTDPAAQLEKIIQLTGELPAAVFWAGDPSLSEPVLWRHLRGINMVLLPRSALPLDEQPHALEDHASALFRHADPNVMAQIFHNISTVLAARLFGPSDLIVFKPEPVWWTDGNFAWFSWNGGPAVSASGMPFLSVEDVANIERNRKAGLKRRAVLEFAPRIGTDRAAAQRQILDAFDRAEDFELQEADDIWKFIEMDVTYGHRFERSGAYAAAAKELSYTELSAAARLHYAENACRKAYFGEVA